MSRLDEKLGSVGFDNLINGLYPPAEVFSIQIRKEATIAAIYKRGTVLALSGGTAGDGTFVLLGSTPATNETLTANCVLAEDTEVGTGDNAATIAYRTGHFNANNLTVAEGYTIKAADKEALRSAGILLSDAVEV